jgi:hypothetical protein
MDPSCAKSISDLVHAKIEWKKEHSYLCFVRLLMETNKSSNREIPKELLVDEAKYSNNCWMISSNSEQRLRDFPFCIQ